MATSFNFLIITSPIFAKSARMVLKLWLYVVVIYVMTTAIAGLPHGDREKRETMTTDALNFLVNFGYIPKEDIETGSLKSRDELQTAVKQMQRFAGLPQTGELDRDTLRMMSKERCGNKDPVLAESGSRKKRYVLNGLKWHKTDLTWTLEPNRLTRDVSEGDVIRAFNKAFKLWSDSSSLTFRRVSAQSNADIRIAFHRGAHGDNYDFDGQYGVLAHAFFPGGGIGGDAHFDDDERWTSKEDETDGFHLLAVSAHEFGHSLGLDHSDQTDALMFPYYQGYQNTLPLDDTKAIQHLYGPPKSAAAPRTTTRRPRRTYPTRKYQPYTQRPRVTTRRPRITKRPRVTTRRPPRRTRPTYKPRTRARTPPTTPVTRLPEDESPDKCSIKFDAVADIRGEFHVYSGKYFWRMSEPGRYKGNAEPILISSFWKGLTTVDAAYQRPRDSYVVFFSGKQYWLYRSNVKPVEGYPKPLTDLGLPADLDKIDAAFIWGHNKKTYFFSGDKYWRFDEKKQKVEQYYPRNIKIWRGVPADLDSAFRDRYGDRTFFIKGHEYWKFEDQKMQVAKGYPKEPHEFLGCPAKMSALQLETNQSSSSPSNLLINGWRRLFLSFLLVCAALAIL